MSTKILFKHISLCFVSVVISFLLADFVGNLYVGYFQEGGGWDMNLTPVAGFMFAYTFFVTLLVILLGEQYKYRWLVGFILPIIAFELFTGFVRLWLFLLLALIGWALALGLAKVLPTKK